MAMKRKPAVRRETRDMQRMGRCMSQELTGRHYRNPEAQRRAFGLARKKCAKKIYA